MEFIRVTPKGEKSKWMRTHEIHEVIEDGKNSIIVLKDFVTDNRNTTYSVGGITSVYAQQYYQEPVRKRFSAEESAKQVIGQIHKRK